MSEFLTAPSPALIVDEHMQRRALIHAVESRLLTMPQCDIPVRHYFSDGLYAREITIPAGALVTGAIHTTEHLNIVSKGEISVVTEQGTKRLSAPCTFVSPPGTKKVGFIHSETVWTTIHGNAGNEKDPEVLERLLTSDSYDLKPSLHVVAELKLE